MSGFLSSLQGMLSTARSQFITVLDRVFPPEQRAEMFEKLQKFAINNPKLAAFLTAQIAFTGFPLLMFIAFGITVFLFSLIAALLIGLIAALLFTVLTVGVALIVILPIVFLTTFAATSLFLWGLGGYYILNCFNEGAGAAPDGKAIGDKINSLTGGRMGWLVDGTRKKVDDARTGVEQTSRTNGSDDNGHVNNGKPKRGNGKNGNGTATSTGVSDDENHAHAGKETVTKRPPKSNNSAANGAKDASGGDTGH